jgi:hypothetical protein
MPKSPSHHAKYISGAFRRGDLLVEPPYFSTMAAPMAARRAADEGRADDELTLATSGVAR